MEQTQVVEESVAVQTENIGGIEEATVEFEPGVAILAGRNATNKTSLLQAIMAGLGSDTISLKSDADEGSVSLQIGDKGYTRTLERRNGEIVFGGEPFRDDTELADLFAFLLPSNEARRTVELGGNLRDVIMEPIDTDAIQAEITQLQREKKEVEDEIDRREELDDTLAQLKQRRAEIEADIETKREQLAAKQEQLDAESTDTEQARSEQSELERKIDELQDVKSSLEDVKFRIDSEQQSRDSLKDEREELEEARAELADETTGDIDQIESSISRLRTQKQRLESELSELQSVIQFNEEMLDGDNEELTPALHDDDNDSVTDQLLDTDSTVCWTCGTTVAEERIEDTVAALRELRQSKYSEQQEIETELAELKDEKSTIESRQNRRETVERKLADVESEIEQREGKIEDLEAEREQLRDTVEELEAEIEKLGAEDRSEVLDLQSEVNRLEIELDRLEDDRDQVTDRIDDVEDQLAEVDELREQREAIVEELEELRTRVGRIEREAVEEFNDHMETVLDILEYENLDRIWIDRVEQERRQGRRKVTETEFRLHVVRSNGDGVTYEDEFEHLSESEREVTALVFALAGYLAHDVYEDVPFILLDSLEAIDAQRIDTLVDYLTDYAEYLVVTLLPEDAAEVETPHQRIAEI